MNLLGEFRHTVDAKNRLFIPSKYREEIGGEFFVTRRTETCLAIYPPEKWKSLSDKLNSFPDSQVAQIKRFIFSKSAALTPESHGRIILPTDLIKYAQIEKNVVIAGMGDYAEIWSDTLYDKMESELDISEMDALLRELGL